MPRPVGCLSAWRSLSSRPAFGRQSSGLAELLSPTTDPSAPACEQQSNSLYSLTFLQQKPQRLKLHPAACHSIAFFPLSFHRRGYASASGDAGSVQQGVDATSDALQSAVSAADSNPVLETAMDLIAGLQSVTGLPWWASIPATAFAVRLAVLPLLVQQLQATSALAPLLRQAWLRNAPGSARKQPEASEQRSAGLIRRVWGDLQELRRDRNTPHPAWLLAAPAVQIPVFITSVMAVRRMALHHWSGFETGGVLWFNDLTLSALTLHPLDTPMGAIGIALPTAVAVALLANFDQSFGRMQAGVGAASWLLPKLKLLLDWTCVPVLVVATQLPQGALLYWLASLSFTLTQSSVLRLEGVRSFLRLQPQAHAARIALDGSIPEPEAAGKLPGTDEDSSKINALFIKAAEARAAYKLPQAIRSIADILQLQPEHARALHAMGQLQAHVKRWPQSEQAYAQAADAESEPEQRARCWYGAGVARSMQGKLQPALDAFEAAISDARSCLAASSNSAPASSDNAYHSDSEDASQADEQSQEASDITEVMPSTLPSDTAHAELADASHQASRRTESEGADMHMIVVRRTLVRSMVSAAAVCKGLDRMQQAVHLLTEAAGIEPSVQQTHLQPLLKEQGMAAD